MSRKSNLRDAMLSSSSMMADCMSLEETMEDCLLLEKIQESWMTTKHMDSQKSLTKIWKEKKSLVSKYHRTVWFSKLIRVQFTIQECIANSDHKSSQFKQEQWKIFLLLRTQSVLSIRMEKLDIWMISSFKAAIKKAMFSLWETKI